MNIEYVENKDIDREKWDELIAKSSFPLFYGLSDVYDHLADNWNALILNDYKAVMPLPFKTKFGILPYIYQPYFIQQSGIFSEDEVTESLINSFLNKIPKKFVRVETHFNYGNKISALNSNFTRRRSFEINLNREYSEISNSYNKDCQKNLRQIEKLEISINNKINLTQVIDLYTNAYGELNPGIKKENYNNFKLLLEKFENENRLEKVSVILNNEIIGGAVFVKCFNRIHYVLGAPTEEGRKVNITHAIIDFIIKKYSGQNFTFDFEGSEIEGVANFYKKFNPVENHFLAFSKRII